MKQIEHLRPLDTIPATEENAKRMRELVQQGAEQNRFPDPTAVADPNVRSEVEWQLDRLKDIPHVFFGYYDDTRGELSAFTRAGEWFVEDEGPFISPIQRMKLKMSSFARNSGSMTDHAWGIFATAVTQEYVNTPTEKEILKEMYDESIRRALADEALFLNVALSGNNETELAIVTNLGFQQLGRRGEAAGAPGLLQQRYQLPLEGIKTQ